MLCVLKEVSGRCQLFAAAGMSLTRISLLHSVFLLVIPITERN